MPHESSIPINPSRILRDISEISVVIGLTIFLPFVVHLIPSWDDSPIGAKFLPIFYAPLIAALTRKLHISLIACLLSPWLNYLLLGSPILSIAAMLCIQLIPFAYITYRLGQHLHNKTWIGPVAYLLSKPIILLLFVTIPEFMPPVNAVSYTIGTTINALPGILILALLGFFSNRIHPPAAHV